MHGLIRAQIALHSYGTVVELNRRHLGQVSCLSFVVRSGLSSRLYFEDDVTRKE